MIRRGCGIGIIIEGLVINREGIVTESAEEQVQKDINTFLKERSVSGTDKKKLLNLLSELYGLCNNVGPYKLVKGDVEKVKGGVEDDSNPDAPVINPTLYEYSYIIKFLSGVNVKDLYKSIYDTFKKSNPNYSSIDIDPYAIVVVFEEGEEGLYLAISKENRGLKVVVGYQSLVIEGKTGAFGNEIGLPIDHENNESTSVAGVSTPTGKFVSKKSDSEDDKDKEIIDPNAVTLEDATYKKEGDIERLVCPKCKSPNVNSDGESIICSDCGFTWNFNKVIEKDVDNMLPQDDDVSASEVETPYRKETNEIECLETQQNVDRRDGIQ